MGQVSSSPKSILIIGAGIAGLTAGVYARRCGYQADIYEMHSLPGGLMTAWKRKGYIIDGCIHWLTGSSPRSDYYQQWQEIGLLNGQKIYDPEIFYRYEALDGKIFNFYTNIDQLEKHLQEISPEDADYIHKFCSAAHKMVGFNMSTESSGSFVKKILNSIKSLPKLLQVLPQLQKWGSMEMTTFSANFKSPFLREVFTNLWMPEMSAGALVFTMAFLHDRSAGYPVGGSLPMAQGVEKRFLELGGQIHYNSRVEKILVENDRAAGIRLADGSEHRADYVISAADGHATIFDMLEGRYVDDKIRKVYSDYKLFPPILLVSLGIHRTFPELPGATAGIAIALKDPITIAGEKHANLELMVYNFDPTLAPEGKTIVTTTIPTSYTYWKELVNDRERYDAEKQQVAIDIINRLEQRFAGVSAQVEMADVATPVTFERYTGNWQGSFEGFLPTPKTIMSSIPKTLPGLQNFYMAGQWVQAGGGLPSGLMTGRDVIKKICKLDQVPFV